MSESERFHAAVRLVQAIPKEGPFQPSNDLKLKFYAYYKQATSGKCITAKPSFWDIINRAKWSAWNDLGEMSGKEAEERYVDALKEVVDAMPLDNMADNFLKEDTACFNKQQLPSPEQQNKLRQDFELALGPMSQYVTPMMQKAKDTAGASCNGKHPLDVPDSKPVPYQNGHGHGEDGSVGAGSVIPNGHSHSDDATGLSSKRVGSNGTLGHKSSIDDDSYSDATDQLETVPQKPTDFSPPTSTANHRCVSNNSSHTSDLSVSDLDMPSLLHPKSTIKIDHPVANGFDEGTKVQNDSKNIVEQPSPGSSGSSNSRTNGKPLPAKLPKKAPKRPSGRLSAQNRSLDQPTARCLPHSDLDNVPTTPTRISPSFLLGFYGGRRSPTDDPTDDNATTRPSHLSNPILSIEQLCVVYDDWVNQQHTELNKLKYQSGRVAGEEYVLLKAMKRQRKRRNNIRAVDSVDGDGNTRETTGQNRDGVSDGTTRSAPNGQIPARSGAQPGGSTHVSHHPFGGSRTNSDRSSRSSSSSVEVLDMDPTVSL